MTVLAQPRQPLRLVGVFVASVAAFALIAAAAGAVLYIIDNETSSPVTSVLPQADVDLPPGMVLVRSIESADQWRDSLGFAPVIPESLPAGIDGEPLYFLQQPDARGRTAGHVRFASEGGPTLILVQQEGRIAQDSPLRTQESDGSRAYLESFACGTVVMQTQLYFSTDGASPPTASESFAIASAFSESLHQQCAD